MIAFLRYLAFGSDELTMPKTWLENTDRLKAYEGYTRRQLQQGAIVRDVAAMRRAAFWAKYSKPPATITKFPAQVSR